MIDKIVEFTFYFSSFSPLNFDSNICVRVERDTLAVYLRILSHLAYGVGDDSFRSYSFCNPTIFHWQQSHGTQFRASELSFRGKF